jgi:hypothetical protein
LVSPSLTKVYAQKAKVDNVRYEISGDNIEIYYDLVGLTYKKYKVSVLLKREQSNEVIFKPKALSGDVGKGKFAGGSRKIIWNYVNEFKPESGVNDYYFEVSVKPVRKTWGYFVGGGVLLGGGAAAIILLQGNNKKSQPEPEKSFPVPTRP